MKRRSFLASAGCTIFLPALESLGQVAKDAGSSKAKRLLCLNVGQGICTDLMPKKTGADYETTSTFEPIDKYRDQYTVYTNFTGAGHHPNQMLSFADYGIRQRGQIKDSLDQLAATHIGHHTRVRNVVVQHNAQPASWKNGLPVSPTGTPKDLFQLLFGKIDKQKERELIELNKSVLDASRERAKQLMASVSSADRAKLEEYFASIRESENTIRKRELWLEKPQPEVPYPEVRNYESEQTTKTQKRIFADKYFVDRDIMLDLIHLAFKFDITRVVHFYASDVHRGHHGVTHTIGRKGSVEAHGEVDASFTMQLAHYFKNLTATKTASGATLMGETITLITAGNSICEEYGPHNGQRLPVIVAGGGFKHGRHLTCTKETPRSNLYLTALHQLGIGVDRFARSTGTVDL